MAMIIRDSFDFYSALADAGANFWDTFASASCALDSSLTRFNSGQSLRLNSATNDFSICTKNYGSNEATTFVCFALLAATLASATSSHEMFRINLYDSATVQCCVALCANGDIEVWRGNPTSGGTKLTTFKGAFSGNIWTHFQIKMVVNGTTGEVHVRKNGNTLDDFSSTGLNLISTANSYANKIELRGGWTAGTTIQMNIDDLAIYSGSGSSPWNDWVGDIRAIQLMPSADTAQKQFTPSAPAITFGTTGSGSTWTAGGNACVFCPVKPSASGTLSNSITLKLNASMTGNMVLGLYDSDGPGGLPGTKLVQSAQVTNPVLGVNTFTFGSSVSLIANHQYYWAFNASAGSYILQTDSSLASQTIYYFLSTYSSTLPSSVATTSLTAQTQHPVSISGSIPITNSGMVREVNQDGFSTYVSDSTVGDYDLYDVTDLSVTPINILGISARAFLAKSDAGARTGQLRLQSGSSFHDTAPTTLSTSIQNHVEYVDTDPATGSAWTASGVNAAQIGPKVAS